MFPESNRRGCKVNWKYFEWLTTWRRAFQVRVFDLLTECFFDGFDDFLRFWAGEAAEAVEEDAFSGNEEFVEIPAYFPGKGRLGAG